MKAGAIWYVLFYCCPFLFLLISLISNIYKFSILNYKIYKIMALINLNARSLLTILCIVNLLPIAVSQNAFPPIDCAGELENLSIGHKWLTDGNYKKFKKENQKLFVLGVSDSSCNRCCQSESVLNQLKEEFDAKVYTGKKGIKIKVARVDISGGHKWLAEEGIINVFNPSDLPAILVMHEGTYYRYNADSVLTKDVDDVSTLLNFINRLQHPLVTLETAKEVETFLDSNKEYVESTGFFRNKQVPLGANYDDLRLKTRVIAFIFDKDEYEQELKFIREVAKLSAQRVSLRIGLVTDARLIRKYKESYGTYWFPDNVQLSTVIV